MDLNVIKILKARGSQLFLLATPTIVYGNLSTLKISSDPLRCLSMFIYFQSLNVMKF